MFLVDLKQVEFRLVYRPTNPKEDDILLIIGEEFLINNYLLEEDDIFLYRQYYFLGNVVYSIPFNRPSEFGISFLENLEFVVIIDQIEYLLFRGIATSPLDLD